MFGYIYKTTNKINGKIYIGQHIRSSFDNNYFGSGTIIQNAIKKYGKSNFTVELLEEAFSLDSLNELEKEYISKYNSVDEKIGYNIKLGGNNSPCPNYIKDKISKANKNKYKNHTYINKLGIEKHIDKSELENFLNDGWSLGRCQSTIDNLKRRYNYSSKGMLGKKQSDVQKEAARKANSYKRTEEQKSNFSKAKKVPDKFVCMRNSSKNSTIRCRKENIDKYIQQGYILCK